MSTVFVGNPDQAATVFSQNGGFPRQRGTFIVRFVRANYSPDIGTLTFYVKEVDRPRIQPRVEELNQYNKKRQVYTGVKTEPVKIKFYDSADGNAQKMWAEYSQYYFGDFAFGNEASFAYDATSPEFLDIQKSDFGLTGRNGSYPANTNPNSQFFFVAIDILHFYSGIFDLYRLVNPKITSFDPDSLDYASSEVSLIDATFAYEALLYYPTAGEAAEQNEFLSQFNGDTPEIIGTNQTLNPGTPVYNPANFVNNITNLTLQSLMGGSTFAPFAPNYRYYTPTTNGVLGAFGDFSFGINQNSLFVGAPNFISNVSTGNTVNGTLLSNQQYGTINSNPNSNGTSQYGFNNNASLNGNSYGFVDPSGFNDPSDVQPLGNTLDAALAKLKSEQTLVSVSNTPQTLPPQINNNNN